MPEDARKQIEDAMQGVNLADVIFGAARDATESTKARSRLAKAIGTPDTAEDHVARWNDAPERTKEQVLAVFDSAIAAA